MKVTPVILAAELGYAVTAVKAGGTDGAVYTLEKDARKIVLDQTAIDDIAAMIEPVENPDADSRIKAVG